MDAGHGGRDSGASFGDRIEKDDNLAMTLEVGKILEEKAINNTTNLLNLNNFTNFQLFLKSHEFVDQLINIKVKCFIYNLGYLPTGNKSITTNSTSTIISLKKALELLDDKGIIAFVVYPGHESGKIEANELEIFVNSLNQKEYDVIKYQFVNQINNPPYALIIERR